VRERRPSAVAATGRLSSSYPNLQNIPSRTAEGRRIRQAFIAEPGNRIVAADYSQIELRIMAHLSSDEGLLRAFNEGQDVHRATASEVFEVGLEDVSAEQRRKAKARPDQHKGAKDRQRQLQDQHLPNRSAQPHAQRIAVTDPEGGKEQQQGDQLGDPVPQHGCHSRQRQPRNQPQNETKPPMSGDPAKDVENHVTIDRYLRLSGNHVARSGKAINTNTISTMIRNIGIAARAI